MVNHFAIALALATAAGLVAGSPTPSTEIQSGRYAPPPAEPTSLASMMTAQPTMNLSPPTPSTKPTPRVNLLLAKQVQVVTTMT
jgi:hypothetical protein